MGDLVKKLEWLATFWSLDFDAGTPEQNLPTAKACHEAAEEIERLRNDNETLKSGVEASVAEIEHLEKVIEWWRERYNDVVCTVTKAAYGECVEVGDNREYPLSNGAKALVNCVQDQFYEIKRTEEICGLAFLIAEGNQVECAAAMYELKKLIGDAVNNEQAK